MDQEAKPPDDISEWVGSLVGAALRASANVNAAILSVLVRRGLLTVEDVKTLVIDELAASAVAVSELPADNEKEDSDQASHALLLDFIVERLRESLFAPDSRSS